jgi:hypothetical protein
MAEILDQETITARILAEFGEIAEITEAETT